MKSKFETSQISGKQKSGIAGLQNKSNKDLQIQHVQYECVKSELKDDYLKKISIVERKLHKKAENDLSFTLMNNLTLLNEEKDDNFGSVKTRELKKLGAAAQNSAEYRKENKNQRNSHTVTVNRDVRHQSPLDTAAEKGQQFKFYLKNA